MLNITQVVQSTIAATVAVVSSVVYAPQAGINPTPVSKPPKEEVKKDMVKRSGEYSYRGYTLKYTLDFPKAGGKIRGNFDGVCKGPIKGEYTGGEGGDIKGSAKANCKILFINYNLKADYTGKLYPKAGQITILWSGDIPYTSGKGAFTIGFEPVK